MAHYKGAATEATRAMHILKKRERAREELEEKKKKIEGDIKLSTIDNKFAAKSDSVETQMRSSTVGLVTLDQMRKKQEDAAKEREKQKAHKLEEETRKSQPVVPAKVTIKQKTKTLSFHDDDDDDDEASDDDDDDQEEDNVEEDGVSKRKKPKLTGALQDVDTSLLPDREREEEERLLREQLAAEWRERQQRLKEEEVEITFSYWDGSGHRRQVRMKKGNSIYEFLKACLETLRKDFNELRAVSADQLMYVKEDLIIPHHYTFYDFIVTKARGKSGPLFSFDVHEDVRLIADATVEKDESHAGKVLLRSWYERNKHIFPASRWEPYDPTRVYEKYTISDKRSK